MYNKKSDIRIMYALGCAIGYNSVSFRRRNIYIYIYIYA